MVRVYFFNYLAGTGSFGCKQYFRSPFRLYNGQLENGGAAVGLSRTQFRGRKCRLIGAIRKMLRLKAEARTKSVRHIVLALHCSIQVIPAIELNAGLSG